MYSVKQKHPACIIKMAEFIAKKIEHDSTLDSDPMWTARNQNYQDKIDIITKHIEDILRLNNRPYYFQSGYFFRDGKYLQQKIEENLVMHLENGVANTHQSPTPSSNR